MDFMKTYDGEVIVFKGTWVYSSYSMMVMMTMSNSSTMMTMTMIMMMMMTMTKIPGCTAHTRYLLSGWEVASEEEICEIATNNIPRNFLILFIPKGITIGQSLSDQKSIYHCRRKSSTSGPGMQQTISSV